MTSALQIILARGLLVTALVLPGMSGLVGGGELETLQETYERKREQRRQLVDEMHRLEDEYGRVVERIDQLKAKGTDQIPNRLSVEDLMRRSGKIADRLEQRQNELTELDARIRQLREAIRKRVDQRIDRLEDKLPDADDDERRELVDRLNELRSLAGRYEAELPEAPDPSEIQEKLSMASQVSPGRPDQMAAAADALQDTEDELERRLEAIDEKLASLTEARMLARRDRTFGSEERFFDDESRPQGVRRREGSSTDEASGAGGDESNSTGDEAEAGAPTDGTDPGESEPSSPPAAGAPTDGDRESGAGFRDPTKSPDDRSEPASAAPAESTSGGSSQNGGEFVIESRADPSTSVDSTFESEKALESRIENLKKEREELEEQAEKLREKAQRLRERAKNPGDVE